MEQTGELSISKAKKLASVARTPFGYLFLAEPLSDALPIPDFGRSPMILRYAQAQTCLKQSILCNSDKRGCENTLRR